MSGELNSLEIFRCID